MADYSYAILYLIRDTSREPYWEQTPLEGPNLQPIYLFHAAYDSGVKPSASHTFIYLSILIFTF